MWKHTGTKKLKIDKSTSTERIMAYTLIKIYGYIHNINESTLLNNKNKSINQVRYKQKTTLHTINHDD